MNLLEIHADDYALSLHASRDIRSCLRKGRLDSVSVLTNMSCYEECVKEYLQERKNWPRQPLLSVHLNFMEGHCLADPEKVPHLVDREGYFKIGWGTLFIWNYSPKKFRMIKKELKEEIRAQTERFLEAFGRDVRLRFDGHQHTQMIPLVYQALLEVIAEQRYGTDYIRVTREPARPYLRSAGLWKTYRPVNWVKNILLNLYAPGMERALEKNRPSWQRANGPMYLWGVVMSGHMDAARVRRLLPDMRAQAAKKGRHLEVLFHPGTVLESELGKEFCNKGANGFHISEGRREEYEAVMSLGDGRMEGLAR